MKRVVALVVSLAILLTMIVPLPVIVEDPVGSSGSDDSGNLISSKRERREFPASLFTHLKF